MSQALHCVTAVYYVSSIAHTSPSTLDQLLYIGLQVNMFMRNSCLA